MKNAKSHLACGTCIVALLVGLVATPSAQAQTFKTLQSFDGTDGSLPERALVQATNGSLYGTTETGGAGGFCTIFGGCGTAFKITPSGALTTLYNFCSQGSCTDGYYPAAALVQATDGNFYGTTANGGANGGGTVFKITPGGTLTVLHSFDNFADGFDPAGLVQATDGNFYGTTRFGTARDSGTVFKITPSGTLTTLYTFCSQSGCTDGTNPEAPLVQATDGNLYGTTSLGGANGLCSNGCGTVFRITPSGVLTTLHKFDSTDGAGSAAALVQATDGNFYGTSGGGINGEGTVFKITPSGRLTTLYSFCSQGGGCTDGAGPSTLIQATDANFYGTTVGGGAAQRGSAFQITSGGTLTTLFSFGFQNGDGAEPFAALVQDTSGEFYGTTSGGGANRGGTVFSLSVGLGPFVETQTTSGKVGATVKILGTNLTGATSVSFNGTAATFTVVSSSLITTTVPAGATTGTVQVVTPSGTLSSNVPFRVLP